MDASLLAACREKIRRLEEENKSLQQQNTQLEQEVHSLKGKLQESQEELRVFKYSRNPRLTMEKIVNNSKLVCKIIIKYLDTRRSGPFLDRPDGADRGIYLV